MNPAFVVAALAALVWFSRKPDVMAAVKSTPVSAPRPQDAGKFTTDTHADLLIDLEDVTAIDACVMLAIEQHETASFTSFLWKEANNPGGIKFNPELHTAFVKRADDTADDRFAKFATWQDGIRGHAKVLAAKRYDPARLAADPYVQVDRIKAAGYATDPKWPDKVKAFLNKILSDPNSRI